MLSLVWWPAYMLTTLFLDELIADGGRLRARASRLAAAGVLTWVVAGSAWGLADRGPFLRTWYGGHLVAALKHRPGPSIPDAAAIERAMRRGERVLTISWYESLLSARLKRPSEWRSSLVEALLVEDFRAMARRVDRGEFDRIWVGHSVLNGPVFENRGVFQLSEILRRASVVEETPHGFLIDPRATSADLGALPPISNATRLHAIYSDGRFDSRPPLPAMTLGRSFTIEAIVRPDGDQIPTATLFGNHPGRSRANTGFTLQRSAAAGNDYALFVGDGRAFHEVSSFRLDPGRWSCVAIAVGGGAARTYLDGRLVDSRPLPEGLTIVDSDLPVIVGDWHAGIGRSAAGSRSFACRTARPPTRRSPAAGRPSAARSMRSPRGRRPGDDPAGAAAPGPDRSAVFPPIIASGGSGDHRFRRDPGVFAKSFYENRIIRWLDDGKSVVKRMPGVTQRRHAADGEVSRVASVVREGRRFTQRRGGERRGRGEKRDRILLLRVLCVPLRVSA